MAISVLFFYAIFFIYISEHFFEHCLYCIWRVNKKICNVLELTCLHHVTEAILSELDAVTWVRTHFNVTILHVSHYASCWSHTFHKDISTKWKAKSLVQNLNLDRRVYLSTTITLEPRALRYIYIYIVIHRQICFVLSEIISLARHTRFP